MPKKTKVVEVQPEEAQETEEVSQEIEAEEEVKIKPKRILSEKQLETLALARVKAAEVKKKNKEEKLKALSLSKKENEIKAIEYDQLEEKKNNYGKRQKQLKKLLKK